MNDDELNKKLDELNNKVERVDKKLQRVEQKQDYITGFVDRFKIAIGHLYKFFWPDRHDDK
jgi:hypothetical protein